MRDVRLGSQPEVGRPRSEVRFTLKNGSGQPGPSGPKGAKGGHRQSVHWTRCIFGLRDYFRRPCSESRWQGFLSVVLPIPCRLFAGRFD